MDEILFEMMQDPISTLLYIMSSTGSGVIASIIFKKLRELYPQPKSIRNFSINKGAWKKLQWQSHFWFYKSLWIRRYAFIHVILLSVYVSVAASLALSIIYRDVNIVMSALLAAVSNQTLYNWKKRATHALVVDNSDKEEGTNEKRLYGYPGDGGLDDS